MSSTTYRPKVDLTNIPATIAAAKTRTGRAPGVIAADLAAVDVHCQDLQASVQQIAAAVTADDKATGKKLEALRIASKPAAIEVAGMVIRRTDPAAEAQALADAMRARADSAIAQIKALNARQDSLQELIAALFGELDRAGVPEPEARAWLKSGTVTRVTKAAAA